MFSKPYFRPRHSCIVFSKYSSLFDLASCKINPYFLNKSISGVGEAGSAKSDFVIKGADFFTLVALDGELSREPASFEGKLF